MDTVEIEALEWFWLIWCPFLLTTNVRDMLSVFDESEKLLDPGPPDHPLINATSN